MAENGKRLSKDLINKGVVSKSGKRFGIVGDISFETKSGELIHIVLTNPTVHVQKLDLEKDNDGSILIPFSSVVAIGDFLVVSEEDIV